MWRARWGEGVTCDLLFETEENVYRMADWYTLDSGKMRPDSIDVVPSVSVWVAIGNRKSQTCRSHTTVSTMLCDLAYTRPSTF